MSKIDGRARSAHAIHTRTGETDQLAFAESLLPVAARLIGTVRDEGPDAVAAVLADVPDGRHDALAVILAAMVDPDRTPAELLAWTAAGPVPSRDGVGDDPVSANPAARPTACPDCGRTMRAGHLARHRRRHHPDAIVRAA